MSRNYHTYVNGLDKVKFDWIATQRKAAATLIPIVLTMLKTTAPVSATKPDAGRFKASIGYRVEPLPNAIKINFVSTASYAQYVINPTTGGQLIYPNKAISLKYKNGFGDTVFAKSVVRGDTPGNDFHTKVANDIKQLIVETFKKSSVIVTVSS